MADSRTLGFEKEKEAAAFIKKKGYKILSTNYATQYGEIDIIAKHKKDIVFIEVKYRKSSFSGAPQEAVTYKKQQKIIKSAAMYIKENKIKENIRFDIVAISGGIEIIESAFDAASAGLYI